MTDQEVKEINASATAEAKSENVSATEEVKSGDASAPSEAKSENAFAAKTITDSKNTSTQDKNLDDCEESSRSLRDRDWWEGRNSKREVCRNFLNNCCLEGTLCKNYHPKSESKPVKKNRSRSPISKVAKPSNKNICKYFTRGFCKHGNNCHFYHPSKEIVNWFTLCLNFRSGRCKRHDCRNFHISWDGEEHFRQTGEILPYIVDQALRKASTIELTGSKPPTCKNHLTGNCKLKTCQFRHINRCEYEDEIYQALKEQMQRVFGVPAGMFPPLMPNCGQPQSRGMSSHDGGFNFCVTDNGNSGEDFYPYEFNNAPMGRDFYEAEAYHNGRGPRISEFPGGPPLEDARFAFQNTAHEDYDLLHRNYTQMRNDYMGYRREKEEEISSLMSELKHLQDYMNSSSLDKITIEDLKNSNESLIRENVQVHEDIQRLQEENKALSCSLKAQVDWKELNSIAQVQLQDLQRENQRYKEELSSFRPQLENLKSQTQSIGRFKFFVREQCMNMRSEINSVEGELAHLYGNGPPSLREAWGSLKSLINILANRCMDEEGGANTFNEGSGGSLPRNLGRGGSLPYNEGRTGNVPFHGRSTGSLPYNEGRTGSVPFHGRSAGSIPYNGGSIESVPNAYEERNGNVPNMYEERSSFEANTQFTKKNSFKEETSLSRNIYGGGSSFDAPYNQSPPTFLRGNQSQRYDVAWPNRNPMSHDMRHY